MQKQVLISKGQPLADMIDTISDELDIFILKHCERNKCSVSLTEIEPTKNNLIFNYDIRRIRK